MRMNPAEDRAAAQRDLAACASLLRAGSRSFDAAARLLPASVRDPATALYAFCRMADDAVDQGGDPLAALEHLRLRLDLCYVGRPLDSPVDRAFARTVAAFTIPRALPEGLLEGLAWDALGRRYDTLSDLEAYAARVAGTVGAMMTIIMGRREPQVLARACDLGIAMQLTNIARDVGEDAGLGRIYLPLADLRARGVDPDAFLAHPSPIPAVRAIVRLLLDRADTLYARSMSGIAALPFACRPGIAAAHLLYAEIGREVARRDHDSVSSRAVVPASRKAVLVAKALAAASLPGEGSGEPTARPARFIVDAVAAVPRPTRTAAPGPLLRLLALFERLERVERGVGG